MQLQVKIKKIHPEAKIPTYSKPGDAGMDLTITEIEKEQVGNGEVMSLKFGIAIEIPEGHVGRLYPRSSIYKNHAILSNSVGVIDHGYTGEIGAKMLFNTDDFGYKVGDRAVQLIIEPIPSIKFIEVDELSSSERGDGGFGSSGN